MTGTAEIKRIIPHRYPILLVDRVDAIEPGRSLTAVKAVTAAEPCFADLPDTADHRYPVALLIESWAQAAVLLAVWEQPNPDVLAGKVELAGAINTVRVGAAVRPGDVVTHRVRVVKAIADTTIVEGESLLGTEEVLRVGHFVLALRPLSVLGPRPGETVRA